MFNTLQKSFVMLALIILALGAAFAGASAFSPATTLAASPTGGPGYTLATATPAYVPGAATHRLAALNPQKTRVAAATNTGIMLWALDTGKVLLTLDTQGHTVTDIAFSPDGLALAASASDGTVLIWNVP